MLYKKVVVVGNITNIQDLDCTEESALRPRGLPTPSNALFTALAALLPGKEKSEVQQRHVEPWQQQQE